MYNVIHHLTRMTFKWMINAARIIWKPHKNNPACVGWAIIASHRHEIIPDIHATQLRQRTSTLVHHIKGNSYHLCVHQYKNI